MAFWSDPAAAREPKRQFRFVLSLGLGGTGNTIESYFIKTVKKPSFTVGEIEHQYVAHRFYYPGRITWNPVEITFVDPVEPDASKILADIVYSSGYRIPKTAAMAEISMSKALSSANIGTPQITALDASGETIENWSLFNAFITNMDFGQLDYASDELVVLSMTLRYDYATLTQTASGDSLLVPGGTE